MSESPPNLCLQSLKILNLVDCGLQTCDLKCLAIAKSGGQLPELKQLDISNNVQICGQLEHLFCLGQNWSDLQTLISLQTHAFKNDFQVILAKISSHALENIQDLTITSDSIEFLSQNQNFAGSNLFKLKIVLPFQKYSGEKLSRFIAKCGLKKHRILSVIRVNFNPFFVRLIELYSSLQPFTYPLVLSNNSYPNIEQIGCSPLFSGRIDALDIQSFYSV